MSEYDNRDRGTLFPNRGKAANSKRPDYTGELDVGGVLYRIAAWRRQGKNGGAFLSLKIELPQNRPVPASPAIIDDEDIPF